ncbi:MAG: patatin-like phospholipase family protein [Spirochaetales bacterium]|nr:patatin-like phospholipase family protein [Spirochaetales bacterium]
MKNKLGLVLEGGGAKGAYHLGVYKALVEMGYKFDGIAGTSVGALNGALIAQGDWKKTYDLWYNSSNKIIYGIDEDAFRDMRYATSVLSDFIKSKGIDTVNMKELFYSMISEKKLRKSKIELGIVTVKLPSFKTVEIFKEDIPQGEINSYLMASANFPLFKREENRDGVFIDGGLRNNLPLNLLPKKGINELIAVRTFGVGVTKSYSNPNVKITYIEPSKYLGPTLDFNRDKSRENLTLGYFDAYKQLKGYVGREFCIIPLTEDFSYLNRLIHTADEKILKAANVMGYTNINPKRFMFERLLPQIADYLQLGLDVSYETVLLTFFEEIATTLSIKRDKIYKADEFITLVKDSFFQEHHSYNKYKKLPKIIQSNSFLSSFVKSDFFHFIMDIFLK